MDIKIYGYKEIRIIGLLLFAIIGFGHQALASIDDTCSPRWKLTHHDYDACSNMAMVTPSNDTRINLLLLLADLRASGNTASVGVATNFAGSSSISPLFDWATLAARMGPEASSSELKKDGIYREEEPTKCPDTLPSGDPFVIAVQAEAELTAEERNALRAARKAMQSGCPDDAAVVAFANVDNATRTGSGKAFALYLQGASQFWHDDYDRSAATFTTLSTSKSAWLKESAVYMLGRILIKRAQVGAFDEYGSMKKDWRADPRAIDDAETALDHYLNLYPQGAYAKSARGLKRRGYWLAGDSEKLEEEYGSLLLQSPKDRNISDIDLVQEIDNKLITFPYSPHTTTVTSLQTLLEGTRNPLLLAVLDLYGMRTSQTAETDRGNKPVTLDDLQRQKQFFAGQKALYEYLLAVHSFYVDNKPADVLRIIPDAARQTSFSYLQFSRQMLRGLALETVKDRNTLGFWQQMLPGSRAPDQRAAVEFAIAYHQERAGELQNVFAANSPVRYHYLREVLLTYVADARLLRQQATDTTIPIHERNLALFLLLYKEATRGDAAYFLKDLSMVPANASNEGFVILDYNDALQTIPLGIFISKPKNNGFGCPELRITEEMLSRDAENPTARLCLADFTRLHQGSVSMLDYPPASDELGGTKSLFAGANFVRMNTYIAVVANPKASANDKAYALYRSIYCYAPSGANDCGGPDVPVAQRKAWFLTLKRDYADSAWAKELKYFW